MYEALFRRVLFPAYETFIRRRATARYVAQYERSQWLAPDQLAALQLKKLNELLEYCWHHVPFLQRYWSEFGRRPGPLADVSELAGYPTLTKALITANYQDMIAVPWRGHRRNCSRRRTSFGRVRARATVGASGA